MIKLIAFDWNGTLIADTYAVYEADNIVLKHLGYKPASFADYLKYFDVPVKNYYIGLGLPEKLIEEKTDEIASTFHDFYEKRISKVRSRANTKTILNWLARQKIPAVIISNHTKERIDEQLLRLKLSGYFEEVLGNYSQSSAMRGRNKQERLLEYLAKVKIKPKETIIVGDTIEEIEIAREIGAISVAITHGNCSTPRLKAAKPDFLIYDLKEVIGIIEKLNSPNPGTVIFNVT